MKIPNWGPLFKAIQKTVDDFIANKPLAPSQPMTSAALAAALTQLQSELPAIIAAINARPGVIRGADDILEALDAQGYAWAAQVETAIDAAPGALSAAVGWFPYILGALGAFQPAPIGIPGGWSGARGHIGR